MKLLSRILFVSLFLSVSNQMVGQTIKKSSFKNLYGYQNEIYDIQGLGKIIKQQPQAFQLYSQGQKRLVTAKVLGYTSLGAFALGGLTATLDPSDDCFIFCISTGEAVAIVLWSTVVPICGTIGVIMKLSSNKKFQDSIVQFNESADSRLDSVDDSSGASLSLGASQNGIGLTIQF